MFLQGVVGLLLLFSCQHRPSLAEHEDEHEDGHTKSRVRVLVLGGGLAGLQVGQTLHDAGMTDFLILEANGRVGGRMIANILPGVPATSSFFVVDNRPGAPNPFAKLADYCNLAYAEADWLDFRALDDVGADTTMEVHTGLEKLDEALGRLADGWADGDLQGLDDISLEGALRLYGWHPTTPIDWAVEHWWLSIDFLADTSQISCRHYMYLYGNDGYSAHETFQVVRNSYFGNLDLVNCLHNSFLTPNDPRLKLNTTVTGIRYSDSGVAVSTADGVQYEADYAVLTFSMGVLQQGNVTFTPELPFWKRVAINQFPMGYITTIFVMFNETLRSATRPHYRHMYVSPFRGVYHWNAEVVSVVEGQLNHTQPFALYRLWATEDEAVRVETQALEITKREVMDVYGKIFNSTVPEPEVFVSNINTDPLFYGGGPRFPLGTTNKDFDDLRAPVSDRLFFAGDAYQVNLFAKAALISGNETALVLMDCMHGGSCSMDKFAEVSGCPQGQSLLTSMVFLLVLGALVANTV